MKAKDIMNKKLITVSPDMSVQELAKVLDNQGISGAPVLSREGNLVGVVSQSDLVRHGRLSRGEVPRYHREAEAAGAALPLGADIADKTTVEDVMTPWVISFEEDTEVEELARQMLRKRIHRVVITREGKLCGIITSMDMLRALLAMLRKG